jgi:C4-dicarboxylate-specific signal transduction histidine kinase
VETEHASVDLSLTVESALLFLQRELAVGGIDLESAGLDQPCLVLGDAVQLQIAVVNVIRNGIEALAGRNGRHLLQVRLDLREDAAVVQVSDNGPGFSTDATQLVLSSSKPQGSGIGLFVVRTTLEHHRGRLVIGRSARLGGAEVQLQLPMLECAGGTATEPASATSALPDSSPDR